jgi:tRNA A-37 threonylcarbamoyl transferase component Bud32
MADVFLAIAHGPSGVRKLVVVKCMRAGSEIDGALAQMFLDEGRLAALLSHANVVHTYEVGHGDEGSYIVMEYLHGQALSAIQRAAKPLAPRISARIVADALAGLHYVHELRDLDGTPLAIVHRDLSPPNIFVTHDGVVKLVDFGIAKTAIATRASTEAGIVKGKLAYMAPEQTTSGVVDRRADIYAMGVVLWELLAARRLVEDLSPVSIVRHTLHGNTPLVSTVRAEVDPALDRIVERALRRAPHERYSTALEMREELEQFLAQGPAIGAKELGQLMATHFSAQREQRERQIQSWVAAFTPQQPALEIAAGELAASGEASGLAPLAERLSTPRPEEPRSRLAPLPPQRRFARGALVAGALLLTLTGFALLANHGRSSTHGDAAELATTAAIAARATDPPASPLEVVTHPSLAADPEPEPSSARASAVAPSAKPSLRRPLLSPKATRLPEIAAPHSATPSTSTVESSQTPAPKIKRTPELEHNPYLH